MILIRKALAPDLRRIEEVLSSAQLPTGDIERHLSTFFVADHDGAIVGIGGLEHCAEDIGLLCSFAAAPEFRNQGIAARIFERVSANARQSDITVLYLLTNTAQDYFAKRGFAPMTRDRAPEPIRRTSQYAAEPRCSTATLMRRRIEDG